MWGGGVHLSLSYVSLALTFSSQSQNALLICGNHMQGGLGCGEVQYAQSSSKDDQCSSGRGGLLLRGFFSSFS